MNMVGNSLDAKCRLPEVIAGCIARLKHISQFLHCIFSQHSHNTARTVGTRNALKQPQNTDSISATK